MSEHRDIAEAINADFHDAADMIQLGVGDVLVREGDPSNHVYVVESGSFEAIKSTNQGDVVVGTIGQGSVLGEVTIIAGGRRSTTLRALEPSEVRAIDRSAFETWLSSHGDVTDEISRQACERIDRTQVADMLADLLPNVDPASFTEIVERCELRRLEAGELLFREGDIADAAYFVVGGRLQASGRDVDTVPVHSDRDVPAVTVVGDLGRGDVVGELGLLDDAPRSATVRAVRDTTLARFPSALFEELIVRNPGLMLGVTRGILTRIRTSDRRTHSRVATIAVVVTAPVDAAHVVEVMHDEVSRHGEVETLSAVSVDARLERPGLAQSETDNVGAPRLEEFLHEAEVGNDHLILHADAAPTAWTRRSLRQADRVVVVMSARAGEDERRTVAEIVDHLTDLPDVARTVALVHDSDARPRGTSAVLERFGFHDVVHLRAGHDADLRRLARLASGHGVGLVLSGGGGRGLAHVGVHRALLETGVPIDMVAGCSMGSTIAAAIAQGNEGDELLEVCRRQFQGLLDYTLPVVSVLSGKRMTRSIVDTFGGWEVEDLWLPYYCTSTDLTTSRTEVHRRGDLARAVRASVSIPGILPPVPYGDHLLVDGGVLNNMPFEDLRDDARIGTVVAVDVAPAAGPVARADYGLSASGWRVLVDRVRRVPRVHPGVGLVLLRSMLTGAVHHQQDSIRTGGIDLLLDLELTGVGLLDLERVDEVAAMGYDASIERVRDWVASTPTP